MLGDMKLLPDGDELTRERDGVVPSRPWNTCIVAKVARRVADQPMAALYRSLTTDQSTVFHHAARYAGRLFWYFR